MFRVSIALPCLLLQFVSPLSAGPVPDGYPDQVTEISFTSRYDGTRQVALAHLPNTDTDHPLPMMVALHTWSADYRQGMYPMTAKWCVDQGWAFLQPNFRGPNWTPLACGSDAAVCDVEDAIDAVSQSTNIDPSRIYLVGCSGGGHMALLLAGRAPTRWAAVSAWVPIFDLAAWHNETLVLAERHAKQMEASCGGTPATKPHEYLRRSPSHYLHRAAGQTAVHIHAGIRDGHSGSVPVSHTLHAFNQLAASDDQIDEELITQLTQDAKVPPSARHNPAEGAEESGDPADEGYGNQPPLFRRQSRRATVTLFDGGHEILELAAIKWLTAQPPRTVKPPGSLAQRAPKELRCLPDSPAPNTLLFDHLMDTCAMFDTVRAVRLRQALDNHQLATLQARLKRDFLKTLGEFPAVKAPLNAQVTGEVAGRGYRIEKVLLESHAKHHVTALFYLPAAESRWKAPFPGVLFACGHSANGKALPEYQEACALLARNGFAVLAYDPICQGERFQLRDAPRHGTTTHTLLNVGARLTGRSVVWYEAWDGIRAIDYLLSRDEVDARKPIGMTGTSGGGTQTTFLMAIDPRIGPAAPSCYTMTRTAKFRSDSGPADGCQHLPAEGALGIDHIDYTIMRAPRPTAILAGTRDFFDVRATRSAVRDAELVYRSLNFPTAFNFFESDTQHGMTAPHRMAAAEWMRAWLQDSNEPIEAIEGEFEPHSDETLRVTQSGQVIGDFSDERTVVDLSLGHAKDLSSARQTFSQRPANEQRQTVKRLLGLRLPLDDASIVRCGRIPHDTLIVDRLRIERPSELPIPAVLAVPKNAVDGQRLPAIILAHEDGHQHLIESGEVESRANANQIVLAIDLAGFGETKDVGSAKKYYNHHHRVNTVALHIGRPMLGQHVEQVIAAANWLQSRDDVAANEGVHLVGSRYTSLAMLHASLFLEGVAEVETSESIRSWIDDVVRRPLVPERALYAVPGVLQHYDIPWLKLQVSSP